MCVCVHAYISKIVCACVHKSNLCLACEQGAVDLAKGPHSLFFLRSASINSEVIKVCELFRKSASVKYITSDQPSHTHSPVQLSL